MGEHRLESSADNVTGPSGYGVICLKSRCGCRACPVCGPVLGWRVRQNLLAKAEEFRSPRLFTLTIDRKQFPSAQAAHAAVTDGRYVARLLRLLGVVRWVWVLEFQSESGEGWPHWHILIDIADCGGMLPLKKAWRLWRDTWKLGGLDLQFRKKFRSPDHAVYYITKYLTKRPKAFPRWVLESGRKVRFVGSSKAVGGLVCPDRCTADPEVEAEGDGPAEGSEELFEGEDVVRCRPMLEQVAGCGQSSRVMQVRVGEFGELAFDFLWAVPAAPGDLVELAGVGAVSVRARWVDLEGKRVVWFDEDSAGGIGGAVGRLGKELQDDRTGYLGYREGVIAERKRELLREAALVFKA